MNYNTFKKNRLTRRMILSLIVTICTLSLALNLAGCSGSSAESETGKPAAENTADASKEPDAVTSESGVETPATDTAIDTPATDSAVDTPEVTSPAVEYDFVIETSGTAVSEFLVTNGLGLDVTSFAVKRTGAKKFGSNLKAKGTAWHDGETALLKYAESASAAETSTGGDAAVGDGQDGLYDVKLKLSDGSKITLHSVEFYTHEKITIKSTDGVAFISFVDADGNEVSTYEAEKILKEEAEEKAEAKAKAEAKEKAAQEKTYTPPAKKKKKADDACVDDIVLR